MLCYPAPKTAALIDRVSLNSRESSTLCVRSTLKETAA